MAAAQFFLSGARVDANFRAALFDAANRACVTPNGRVPGRGVGSGP